MIALIFLIGFVLGLYVSSQIENDIEKRTKK